MKYVAIIDTKDELTEDVIRTLRLTFFMGSGNGTSYCFDFDSIKEVPESKPNIEDESDDNYFVRYYNGYNQALKDCGIEKEN
jgi:hypothetical protein